MSRKRTASQCLDCGEPFDGWGDVCPECVDDNRIAEEARELERQDELDRYEVDNDLSGA